MDRNQDNNLVKPVFVLSTESGLQVCLKCSSSGSSTSVVYLEVNLRKNGICFL